MKDRRESSSDITINWRDKIRVELSSTTKRGRLLDSGLKSNRAKKTLLLSEKAKEKHLQ